MSNWTTITPGTVATAKLNIVVTRMQDLALSRNQPDPLPEMIADVTAQIRASVSVGNQLDADTAKIPNSLVSLAKRLIIRRVKDWLEMPLTPNEEKQADDDRSYIARIVDAKMRFETPDTPDGEAEMQTAGGTLDVVSAAHRVATRHTMNGLL